MSRTLSNVNQISASHLSARDAKENEYIAFLRKYQLVNINLEWVVDSILLIEEKIQIGAVEEGETTYFHEN